MKRTYSEADLTEEETCCICEKNMSSCDPKIIAPWLKTICTDHRLKKYCESCFVQWVYECPPEEKKNLTWTPMKDTCPFCRQNVHVNQDWFFSLFTQHPINDAYYSCFTVTRAIVSAYNSYIIKQPNTCKSIQNMVTRDIYMKVLPEDSGRDTLELKFLCVRRLISLLRKLYAIVNNKEAPEKVTFLDKSFCRLFIKSVTTMFFKFEAFYNLVTEICSMPKHTDNHFCKELLESAKPITPEWKGNNVAMVMSPSGVISPIFGTKRGFARATSVTLYTFF